MSPKMRGFSEKLQGAVIQGANNRSFSDAIDLCKINKIFDHLDGDSIANSSSFKYYRFIPADTSSIHIAELQLLKNKNILHGKPFGMENATEFENAFDDNIRTNFNGNNGEWIGIEFEKPVRPDFYKVLPRNNFNVIEPGDRYELFVLDTIHTSLGIKVATTNYLEYNNIPDGAILYLLNQSRGEEFDFFFVRNEKQVWNLMDFKK